MHLKMKDCDEPLFGEGPDLESEWGLIFDGAVNVYGNGIGVVLIAPKGITSLLLQGYDLIAQIILQSMKLVLWVLRKLLT
jgi:hypothetical protein